MQYKLLCCTDTHDQTPPDLPQDGATAWLHAGDICSGENQAAMERQPTPDMLAWAAGRKEAIGRWVKAQGIPIYAVRGNHDVADPWEFFANCQDVTGRLVQIAPKLFLAGIGWAGEYYYDLPREADLAAVCRQIIRQANRLLFSGDRLILLTHYPAAVPEAIPYQYGSECLCDLIKELAPVAVVQGHIHELAGKQGRFHTERGDVLIVNPGPQGGILMVDTEDGRASFQAAGE